MIGECIRESMPLNLVEVIKDIGQIYERIKHKYKVRTSTVLPHALGCRLWPEQSLFIFFSGCGENEVGIYGSLSCSK